MPKYVILGLIVVLGFILVLVKLNQEPQYDCSKLSKESQEKMRAEFEFGLRNYNSTFYELAHGAINSLNTSMAIDEMTISLSNQVKSHYCEPVSYDFDLFKKDKNERLRF